jgi:chromate transporter
MFAQRREDGPNLRARFRYGSYRLKRISRTTTLGGIFLSFLKIGLIGFGGGLAVIGQMRALAVRDRRWLTEHEFAEAFALAQSLPGTAAGNAATYIGLRLKGWRGAAVAMSAFILPSTLMMVGLAILYRHFRGIPHTEMLFRGLNAAVVAFILVTAWRVGKNALTRRWQVWVAIASCGSAILLGATTIEIVLASGLIGIYIDSFAERRWQRWRRIRYLAAKRRARLEELERKAFVGGHLTRALADERVKQQEIQAENARSDDDEAVTSGGPPKDTSPLLRSLALPLAVAMPIMAKLALLLAISSVFLRVGAVTFGGGFVMIPLIEADVVQTKHWLTHQEFADATALGQLTPGPVLITATFIGYRVAGTLGALCATLSIFLPAFVMTIAAGSSLRRFRSNRQVQSFLRGVTPAVVGLLIAAAWGVGRAGIHTWVGLGLMVLCIVVLVRFRPNAFWVIAGAGLLRVAIALAFA